MANGKKRKTPDAGEDGLFEGEEILHGWSGVTVTTHRVFYEVAGGGEHALVSLVLGQIDGTAYRRVHFPWLFALAFVFALMSAVGTTMNDGMPLIVFGGVLALLCVVIYVATRKVALIIAAGTMKIEQAVQGGEANASQARALLRTIEECCAQIHRAERAPGTHTA